MVLPVDDVQFHRIARGDRRRGIALGDLHRHLGVLGAVHESDRHTDRHPVPGRRRPVQLRIRVVGLTEQVLDVPDPPAAFTRGREVERTRLGDDEFGAHLRALTREPHGELTAGRVPDDPHPGRIEFDTRGQGPLGHRGGDGVEGRDDVGGHLRPPPARAEPPVLDVPRRHTVRSEFERQRRAEVEVVLPAPEAAVDHHHDGHGPGRIRGVRQVQVAELLRLRTVGDTGSGHA
ncbi:hypothetical protein AAT18_16080 [Rhodococcus aetherivorans]|nr:hypothetical protein AAT18_16080 [Rhodococcus aetherivorans]